MNSSYDNLPDEVLVKIIAYLDYHDRVNITLINKKWYKCFKAPYIWSQFKVIFKQDDDQNYMKAAINFGKFFKVLNLRCNQKTEKNCDNVSKFLKLLQDQKELQIENFKFEFCEQNPLFYSGHDIVKTLKEFLNHSGLKQLTAVDLSNFPIAFDDSLLDVITTNHATRIQTLNIQNNILIYGITKAALLRFISEAKNLKRLYIQSSCFSSNTLTSFLKEERSELMFLSLLFTRADKFFKSISTELWIKTTERFPKLKVELIFDHSYPLYDPFKVMLPEVPVSRLKLCLQATVTRHILLAADIYADSLEYLVITSTPSKELDEAVLTLVETCWSLRELHVWCRLSEETVHQIHQTRKLDKWTLAFKKSNNDCTEE